VGSERDNIKYLGTQLEFFWSDAGDPKGFHVLDTDTRELEKIYNPHTLFHKIVYDDSKTDYSAFVPDVTDKFVKIVVINKQDLFTFDRFVDKIQEQRIHDLKIAESFDEFLGSNVQTEKIQVEDTGLLLDNYIDTVNTDLDKDILKSKMREVLVQAQTMEVA
jgi:hypothetical protein